MDGYSSEVDWYDIVDLARLIVSLARLTLILARLIVDWARFKLSLARLIGFGPFEAEFDPINCGFGQIKAGFGPINCVFCQE